MGGMDSAASAYVRQKQILSEKWKTTHDTMTSFFAQAFHVFWPSTLPNSTPAALGLPVAADVSKRMRVAVALMATVRLGRASTSGVKYADSADTRLCLLSTYVTGNRYKLTRYFHIHRPMYSLILAAPKVSKRPVASCPQKSFVRLIPALTQASTKALLGSVMVLK